MPACTAAGSTTRRGSWTAPSLVPVGSSWPVDDVGDQAGDVVDPTGRQRRLHQCVGGARRVLRTETPPDRVVVDEVGEAVGAHQQPVPEPYVDQLQVGRGGVPPTEGLQDDVAARMTASLVAGEELEVGTGDGGVLVVPPHQTEVGATRGVEPQHRTATARRHVDALRSRLPAWANRIITTTDGLRQRIRYPNSCGSH